MFFFQSMNVFFFNFSTPETTKNIQRIVIHVVVVVVVVVVVYTRRVFMESTACGENCLPGFRRQVSPVPPTRAVLLCVGG